jgi:hypothetical protein
VRSPLRARCALPAREGSIVMSEHLRPSRIKAYREGVDVVRQALAGATDRELDATPAPGKWSARQIVHHLADSEMTSAVRLRRLIAEDRPNVGSYDEAEYAKRLHYDRPIAASFEAFRFARESTADLLDRLTPAEWSRAGVHPEHGPYSVDRWLEIYAIHAHNHAAQITRARQSVK